MLRAAKLLLDLFARGEYWRLAALLGAMIVTGLLQTVGIASIVPFLAVVANPTFVTENAYLARAYEAFGFASTQQFLIALGAVFLVTMTASNGCAALTNWATVRTKWRYQHLLAQRLLERYLLAPYSFHVSHNSAQLAKRLLGEVSRIIGDVFMPFTRAIARTISVAFIVTLLIWADPLLAIVVPASVGGFYLLAYIRIRKRSAVLGKEATSAKTQRYQLASEAFGGIKDMKVLGRERYFLQRFEEVSRRYAQLHARHELVGVIPRFLLDAVTYGGIVVVILYLLNTRGSLDQVLPLLAIYSLGANRLIPGVQEIFWSAAQVRFNVAALEEVHRDLLGHDSHAPEPATRERGDSAAQRVVLEREIAFDRVTFGYAGAQSPAVSDVSLRIPVRRTSAFVGTTGSGKTTLIDLLLGLYAPDSGRILIDDVPLDASTLPGWRRLIGHVPQSIFLADATVTRNIAFGIPDAEIDRQAVRAAARAAHLDAFVSGLPDQYETYVGERGVRLSGGQRQRIGIARALYHNPELLVLDEATSALDTLTEDVVMQAIGEMAGTRTIVLIAHRLSTVREADVIFVIDRGRLVGQGSYDELVSSNEVFRALART